MDLILQNYGPMGAVVILFGFVMKWLLTHVDTLQKDHNKKYEALHSEHKAVSERFVSCLENHISENTKALNELRGVISGCQATIKRVNGRLDKEG